MNIIRSLTWLVFLMVVAVSPAAAECFKLEGPKGRKKEVLVDCAVARSSVLPPVGEKIDIIGLLEADSKRAAEILGPPYHSYKHDGRTSSMYGPQPNISIEYENDKPITIIFDVIGVASPEDVPARLGLESLPPPVCFAPLDSVFWLNPPKMRMLEVHNPRYKIDGQYVYSVVIRQTSSRNDMEGILNGRMRGLLDGRIKPTPCR
jgi:hypothetical protein